MMEFGADVPVEPAASVILMREGAGDEIEVYMTRRQDYLNFLGGYFVFPGGKVDEQDCDSDILCRCENLGPRRALKILGGGMAPAMALGHWVAAVRELFEEAGVLLVYDKEGNVPDFNLRKVRERFDSYRKCLQEQKMTFGELLNEEKLTIASDQLLYFNHWVTPPGSHRRFDAHFFLTAVPEAQRPRFHAAEISEGFWLKASVARDKASRGEWKMIPPTIYNLALVAKYSSVPELLDAFAKSY